MKEIINLGTYNPNKVSKRNGFHFETQLGSKSKIHKSNKIYCRKREIQGSNWWFEFDVFWDQYTCFG